VQRRILLLITDLQIGGTPTVVRELAIRLHNPPDIHVEVACIGKLGPVAEQLREANIEVTSFDAASSLHLPRTVNRILKLVRARKIDIVFSFLIHANVTAAAASWFLPEVRFIQSIQTTQPNPRWHWRLQNFAQHFAQKIVVPSPSAAQAAREWANVPNEKIVVIPNAVDIAQFTSLRSGRTEGALRIGFIGRLDPIKRISDLVDAMSFLDNRFTLHIFGEGEDRQNIERQIAELNLQNQITMHGSTAKPQAAMQQIDLLVLPSQAEGFGLVLIEAMACGIPVVATNVAGIRDVVRNGENGLLVDVEKPDQLASAIRRIAESDSLRKKLTDAGFEDVRQRFTWATVLPQYQELL
jgi:glycosyltransferase involved in cell wall biosynthesis